MSPFGTEDTDKEPTAHRLLYGILGGVVVLCLVVVVKSLILPSPSHIRPEYVPEPDGAPPASDAPIDRTVSDPDSEDAVASPASGSETLQNADIEQVGTSSADAAPTPSPDDTPEQMPTPAPPIPEPTSPSTPTPTPTPEATPEPTMRPTPESTSQRSVSTHDAQALAFTAVVPNPVTLLGSFRSYQSVAAVTTQLEQSNHVVALEQRTQAVPDGIPPRDLTTLTVLEYRHWDVAGRLEMLFFNDRLYQTEFEPSDAAAYLEAQRRYLPDLPRERSGRSELVRGTLRIASSLDLAVSTVGEKLASRPFLLWQDLRLVEQRDEWDRLYGLKAVE